MHNVKTNAWEVQTEAQALLALAGHSTLDEVRKDREERARQVRRLCAIDESKRGFEIGSGNGIVAKLLSAHCLSLDCNDISASFLSMARAECASCANVQFHQICDTYLAHLSPSAYEFGFSLNVFIHFNPYDVYNYLLDVRRILKPAGLFYFDACTIGDQTLALFKEHAAMYREKPEYIRGLLNFNDSAVIMRLATEAGLNISDESDLSQPGWLKVLVENRG